MSDFVITINSSGVEAHVNESIENRDIIDLLNFNEDNLEELLQKHSSIQAYWEALAIKLKRKAESFDNIWCKKWWAHGKVYARYILAYYGDLKPSIDALTDCVIQAYSRDTTEIEKKRYCDFAYKQAIKKKWFDGTQEEFSNSMFKYLLIDPAWYFEDVVESSKKLREDYKMVANVADKLNSRSYRLDTYTKLWKPKWANTGPMSIAEKEMMGDLSQQSKGENDGRI